MKKVWPMIGFAALVSFLIIYTICWFSWRNGSIMAKKEWRQMLHAPVILVRQVPSSAPFWALPFSLLPDANPYYRCEFYRAKSASLYSAQTYQGASYTANAARIEWDASGVAIVYLDEDPIFECSADGFWRKVK